MYFKNAILLMVVLIGLLIGCNSPNKSKSGGNSEFVDSIQLLTNEISKDSLNPNLFARRAKNYLERGKIDLSLRDIQQALSLHPDSPGLFILLSDSYDDCPVP